MSDMTSLSHQYTTNATFAERINACVLAIKRASLGVSPDAMPSSTELDRARHRLRELVALAVSRLTEGAGDEEPCEEEDAEIACPEEVFERLQERHKTHLSWFLQDLRDTAAALTSGSVLEQRLLNVLDEFDDAADGLASESFRRLWRR